MHSISFTSFTVHCTKLITWPHNSETLIICMYLICIVATWFFSLYSLQFDWSICTFNIHLTSLLQVGDESINGTLALLDTSQNSN